MKEVGCLLIMLLIFALVVALSLLPVVVFGGLTISFAGGGLLLASKGKHARVRQLAGLVILSLLTVFVVWPNARAEWQAYWAQSDLRALRAIPDDLSFQGATVAFLRLQDTSVPCTAFCRLAVEDGDVAVYVLGMTFTSPLDGVSGPDLNRVVLNPNAQGPDDRYIAAPVDDPSGIEVDFIVARVSLLDSWYRTIGGGDHLNVRAGDDGIVVLDGWPGAEGRSVANLTTRTLSGGYIRDFIGGPRHWQAASPEDQIAAQMRILCGQDVPAGATSCPE